MASAAASSRGASQPASGASPTRGASPPPSGAPVVELAQERRRELDSEWYTVEQLIPQGSFSIWRRNCKLAGRGAVPQGAASIRIVSQPATNVSLPDVVAWEKEAALAARRRAVEALQKVSFGGGNDAFREVLRGVHLLLQAPGASSAAKAFTLFAGVTRRCPETAKDSVKAAAREVRDVLVLRCVSEMEPKDHGNRNVFLMVVAKAFGQTPSKEDRNIILHSHRQATWGRPGAFLSNTQRKLTRRKRRGRTTALNVQLGKEMNTAVALFLAGADSSDGVSASDETE